MNKIYRVVWNAEAGQWVVASEMAKGRKKSGASKGTLAALLMSGGALLGVAPHADALVLIQRDKSGSNCEANADDNNGEWKSYVSGQGKCVAFAGGTGDSGAKNPGRNIVMYSSKSPQAEDSIALGGYLDVFSKATLWGGASMQGTKITELAAGTDLRQRGEDQHHHGW
ncbi:ESPR domain-containing protein [Lysobacter soli]|uniref:ESPR domain-containing protein n=1 Tax=Lysobacter soli TaxID=453783 RepID=UPI0036B0B5C8